MTFELKKEEVQGFFASLPADQELGNIFPYWACPLKVYLIEQGYPDSGVGFVTYFLHGGDDSNLPEWGKDFTCWADTLSPWASITPRQITEFLAGVGGD